jgi:ketosteroid isomerase-like protein
VSEAVLGAARELVAAFGDGRVADYFDAFAPEATFVFYSHPESLGSRAAYRELWERWEREDGFRVLACRSSRARVTMLAADVAVFEHVVDTRVATNAASEQLAERETIVFARRDGRWLAVHEHLSPRPNAG